MANYQHRKAEIKPPSKPGNPATLKIEQQDNILPSPEVLEKLEPMAPGVTKKMLEWAEKEQAHRHLMERIVVKRSIALEYTKIVAGLIFA